MSTVPAEELAKRQALGARYHAQQRINEIDGLIRGYRVTVNLILKEEKALLKERDEMAAFIERLEAAFLKARQCPTCKGEGTIHPIGQPIDSICPKCLGDPESMAREALERIKAETGSGDHVAGANKLILTAEQREEEGKRNA